MIEKLSLIGGNSPPKICKICENRPDSSGNFSSIATHAKVLGCAAMVAERGNRRKMHLTNRRLSIGLLVLFLGLSLSCVPLGADPASAQSESFTFKRVKPPTAGAKKRITIQVERTWPYETDPKPAPEDVTAAAPADGNADDTGATAPQGSATYAWFWDKVPHDVENPDPRRLEIALNTINTDPTHRNQLTPDVGLLDDIITRHGAQIMIATAGRRISPAFVLAIISIESSGNTDAISNKGAQGLMQLMPATAKRFGVSDVNNPVENISGGAKYLDWLLEKFKGDPILALAGYNAGENAVVKNGGVPPYAETRAYVAKVVAAWDKARLYCQTLPRYADDGCVFALNRSLKR